jgi:hypothetical protein
MKILYISHVRDTSGWADAAINGMRSLVAAGCEVVSRPVNLNGIWGDVPEDIAALEKNSADNCDYAIQHILPHLYSKCGSIKNIGMFLGETSSFHKVGWSYRTNILDEIWVPTKELLTIIRREGNSNVRLVPYSTDISKYKKSKTKSNQYIFYTICDFVKRKNIKGLLKAFYCEFRPEESVQLIIKTSKFGHYSNQCVELATNLDTEVRNELGLYRDMERYKQVQFQCERLSEEQLASLHLGSDCFVSLSHGEGWNQPALDAIGYGNETILSSCGGHLEYGIKATSLLVDGYWEPAEDNSLFFNYQSGSDKWFVPSISEAMKAMRQKYNESTQTPFLSRMRAVNMKLNKSVALMYSYEKIGKIMKDTLDGK